MSETDTYANQIPDDETSAELSWEIICSLKRAIGAFESPLEWGSNNRNSGLKAEPAYFTKEEESIPYGHLKEIPHFHLVDVMNVWRIDRVTNRVDIHSITHERYAVAPNRMVVASAVGSVSMLEDSIQGEFERNVFDVEMRRSHKDTQPATLIDYANLLNACHDLKPVAKQKYKDYTDYLKNLSKEEMRNVRAMKRDWVMQPELDKTSDRKWWGITYVNQAWLVRASSAEEAVLDLEDHFDRRTEPLLIVHAEAYGENIQNELSEKYEDEQIRRLIPFSIIVWPDDPENMTEEQRAAFDRLPS